MYYLRFVIFQPVLLRAEQTVSNTKTLCLDLGIVVLRPVLLYKCTHQAVILSLTGSRAGDPAGAKVYGRIRYSRTDAFGCLFWAVMFPILSGRKKGSYSGNTVHYKVVYFGFKKKRATHSLSMDCIFLDQRIFASFLGSIGCPKLH